jgi:hypothetical protein
MLVLMAQTQPMAQVRAAAVVAVVQQLVAKAVMVVQLVAVVVVELEPPLALTVAKAPMDCVELLNFSKE